MVDRLQGGPAGELERLRAENAELKAKLAKAEKDLEFLARAHDERIAARDEWKDERRRDSDD